MLKDLWHGLHAARDRGAALAQLRLLEQKLPSPQARFAVPFVLRGRRAFRSIEPRQNPFEIESLYRAVCELAPTRVLEIGTARGGSLYLWTQAAVPHATIVSVDLPGGDFGGSYPLCRVPFYQAFARPTQSMHLLRLDSHAPATLSRVKQLFAPAPVDFAFIDGDHRYEGVRADFEQYGPLVRPGGLIAFHDILPRPDAPSIQVDRLWNELRTRFESREFVGPEGSGRRIGIGVIRVPPSGL